MARLIWAKGGEGTIESLVDDAVIVRSTIPSPPGSRLESHLVGPNGDHGPSLRVKVHHSRKQPDGLFLIDGRVLDMTREVRQFIESVSSIK